MKKKDRQNKGNIDKISATIILQSFMNRVLSSMVLSSMILWF
jgi:RNase H-fold protein (predicted Holliday junction resolvase)